MNAAPFGLRHHMVCEVLRTGGAASGLVMAP